MLPTQKDEGYSEGYNAAMGAIERLTNRALLLKKALEEIEEICDGREDVTESGGPNVYMQILTIVRSAL